MPCSHCDPSLVAPLIRAIPELHTINDREDALHILVYLDGVEQRRAVACLEGNPGWVLRFTFPLDYCKDCGQEPNAELVHGLVEVTYA